MAMADGGLSPRQEAFVAAYLGPAFGVAAEAARIAGYKHPHVQGPRLLRNAVIAARVAAKVAAIAMSPDEILRELRSIATLCWERSIDPKAAMQGKVRALELLGKHHKMWVDRTEHSGAIAVPIRHIDVVDPDPLAIGEGGDDGG